MSKENPTNPPQSLADAEALLAGAAKTYNETGEAQFEFLVQICDQFSTLKAIYMKTPKALRPEPTWDKYAEGAAKRCHLRFRSARMADLYIALHKDIEEVGVEAIKKNVTDGSYREARSVATELSKKIVSDPPVNPAIAHLRRSIKGLENAETTLTAELLLETGPIKASIQSILDRVKSQGKSAPQGQPQGKPIVNAVPVAPPQLPPEWKKRVEDVKARNDKTAFDAATEELFKFLMDGGVEGFPCEVTFVGPAKNLSAQMLRHEPIKKYIRAVTKTLGVVRAAAKGSTLEETTVKSPIPSDEGATVKLAKTTASTVEAPKASPSTHSKVPFQPKNVKEIANALGGQTALGRAAGKQNAHASYWVRQNKLPAEHFAAVIAALKKNGCEPDLCSIATIAKKHAA